MRFSLRWVAIALGWLPILVMADPCRDFYATACGNWSAIHANDPYRSFVGQLDYDYQEELAELLDRGKQDDEPRFLQLLRDFYASCRRPLTKDQVLRVLEKLIALDNVEDEELTVGLTAAFRLEVLVEMERHNMYDIWTQLLTRTDLDWNRNETNREPLSRQKFDLLWQFGEVYHDKELAWHLLSNLEWPIMTNRVEDDDDELPGSLGQPPAFWMLPWPKFKPTYGYLRWLARSLAETTNRFLLIYIYLRLKLVEGPTTSWRIERSECAEQARQILSHPAVWLMEKHHPRLNEEPLLQDVFQELKQRFGQKLRANRNNFSERTQQYLLNKLERMELRLSVLPRNCSTKSLVRRIDRHYEDVYMNATDYFTNLLAGLNHSSLQDDQDYNVSFNIWTMIAEPVPREMTSRNGLYPVQVHRFGSFASPFYMTAENRLLVPLSLLGPPLYSANQADILTYSGLGFVLGHELTHGFDPDGVNFNSRGRTSHLVRRELNRNGRFQRELRCLNRKFGSRRDEKFADANGLELAYSAYFGTAQTDRKRDPLRGSADQKQQFFLNFAQFFCSDEEAREDGDDHGSDRERVNDAVANFEPFREAFDCPTSRNRRRQQCRLF
ncbi:endothelin-converting enzyme homolog [Drosophila gunungcola]|uniref:endothelin-converting enzyme homolog n=1 Tax=Drosophila gunungcola TaxID=103775 RepID=UPI0022E4D54A|nr:endothelin-converting enzyme homolog [Drosophila gunungcola]